MTAGLSRLLASVLAGAVVIGVAWNWPLGREEQPVVDGWELGEKVLINLGRGESYTRVVKVGSRPVTGALLYSRPGLKPNGEMKMRVWQDGREISEGQRVSYSYRRDSTRLLVDLDDFTVPDRTELVFEVTRVSGNPLPLQVSRTGEVLTMALVNPVPLDEGTRQGVLVGVAVMLAVALISCLKRSQWLAAGLLLIVTVPLALAGFSWTTGELGISDWDYFFSLHHYYRQIILEYGEFPFWNPFTCGGTAGLADPEFSVLSPLYPLELFLGVSTGLRLAILVSVAVGGLGVLLLGKRLELSVLAALLAAVGWSYSSATLLKLVEGHVYILAAMWIPWVLWSWLAAWRQRKPYNTLLCGIFLALMFYQGGIYLLFYLGPALVVLGLLVRDIKRGLMVTIGAGAWALGLAAVKLAPVSWWLWQFQDQVYAVSTYTLPFWYEVLLARHLHGEQVLPGQGGGWHEYGAYVGPLIVAISLLAVTTIKRRRLTRVMVVAVAGLILLSSAGPYLKPLLDALPYLPRSYTSRVMVLAVLPLVLLGGIGLDVLNSWSNKRFVQGLRAIIVGLIAVSLISLAYPLSEQAFVLPTVFSQPLLAPKPIAFTNETYPVRHEGQDYDRTYVAAKRGYGALTYCSALGPPIAVKPWHEEGSEYVSLARGSGEIRLLKWQPNRVVARVDIAEAGMVVLNTNYAQGWRVNGEPARNVQGRVGAKVAPGQRDIIFTYRTPGLVFGLLVTVITIVIAVIMVIARPRKKPGAR